MLVHLHSQFVSVVELGGVLEVYQLVTEYIKNVKKRGSRPLFYLEGSIVQEYKLLHPYHSYWKFL
jgi:hypothetical protein